MALTVEIGCYSFEWKGGTFDVEFRPDGVFWCKKFPAEASYAVEGDTVKVDWGKFGKYELRADGGNPKSLVGAVAGSSNPDDWRKANFVRAFTPQEALLSGSAWQLHFEGGSPFRVEFHADGRFVCPSFPGQFTYTLRDDAVAVEWGKYGSYDFTLDVGAKVMAGCLRGNAAAWRRAEYVEPLPAFVAALCSKGCCQVELPDGTRCTKFAGKKRGMQRPEVDSRVRAAFAQPPRPAPVSFKRPS